MVDTLVVNASPLIFLGNAGEWGLLRNTGAARIVVPETVYQEIVASPHRDRASATLPGANFLERVGPSPIPSRILAWDLDPGETEVIALALSTPGAAVVMDDLAGRKCALALGLQVIGTLGLVIAAHRRGEVSDPRQLLLDLRTTGMWLSDAVIARTLALARIKP